MARIPIHYTASSPSGLPASSIQLGPEPIPELKMGAGTVPLLPGRQPSTLLFFSFILGQNNISFAHRLMQKKSWGAEEGGRTFSLARGHLVHRLDFHIVYMESAFLPHKPQKDPTSR